MPHITDDNDNLLEIVVEESREDVYRKYIDEIFVLADKIFQIKVQYDEDPMIMANDAIAQMREYAASIAAIAALIRS